jgi:tetratricopeptide (TPR) repeat protein
MQSGGFEASITDAAALGKEGNFTGAVQLLKDAGVEDSKDAAAWIAYGNWSSKLAEAGIASGKIGGLDAYDAWNDVAWIFESAAKFPGAEASAWVGWSEALLNSNDVKNSLRAADKGLKKHAKSAPLMLQQGRVLMAQARESYKMNDEKGGAKSYRHAEQAFRKAMKTAPKSAAPCLRLGELQWTLLHEGGDESFRQDAVDSFKMAAERDPAGVDGAALGAWLKEDSIPVFGVLIEKEPNNELHYWYRGSQYYAQGPKAWKETRDDFLKVMELNPTYTSAYFFLANGAMARGAQLSNAGDQPTAEKAYTSAAKFWALYLEGFSGEHFNQQKAAGAKALKDSADNMNWLAGKANDPMHRIILLKYATTASPDNGDAWNNLALNYRDTGQAERSRAAYYKALALNPDDPQLMNDYAVIFHYYLKNEDAKVRDLYTRAIARATEMLESGSVPESDVERIKTALRDAKNNLEKLNAGNRKNG